MWKIVTVIAAACVGSTVALENCSKNPEIPKLLEKIEDCYKNREAPKITVDYHVKSALTYVTEGIVPANTKCVNGKQTPGSAQVDVTMKDGSYSNVTYKQEVDGVKIIETGVQGSGGPMMALWVNCGYQNNCQTKREISRFLSCAKQLNVTNLIKLETCNCGNESAKNCNLH